MKGKKKERKQKQAVLLRRLYSFLAGSEEPSAGEEHSLWTQISALPLTSFVILSKCSKLFDYLVSRLQNEGNNRSYRIHCEGEMI